MKRGNEVKSLRDFYEGNPERFDFLKKELHMHLRQKSVKYGEFLLHAEMAPLLINAEELRSFRDTAELVLKGCEIFSRLALENEKWLKDCLPGRTMRELAKTDPGYDLFIPCARFDSFPKKSGPTLIELNTDGCSAMSNIETFHSLYLELIAKEKKSGLASARTIEIMPRLLETLLACYRSFRKRFPDELSPWPAKPTVAILDWEEEPTGWEFYACAEYFRSKGVKTVVADPSQLRYSDGVLSVAGERIHLVYRRLLGEDWEKKPKLLEPLSDAYRDHKVCLVGSPRSQIAFSKKLFAYLRQEEVLKHFPKKVKEAVLKTVPWTVPLKKSLKKVFFKGREIDPLPFILENKDLFVLKPCVSKCGLGILQGCHTEREVWQKAVKAALKKDFIIQEFVPLETALFPARGKVREDEKRYLHTGLYVFGGRFSGFFGRTCKDPLLTLRHGERMLAVLVKK
ncbi:hypothetical protein IKZ40_03415 [bacterium]|nr:hypothetical protein [bacterium]